MCTLPVAIDKVKFSWYNTGYKIKALLQRKKGNFIYAERELKF
jgi:hypothetical protein